MQEPKIIYEDADVLVLDKPAGLIVHGVDRETSGVMIVAKNAESFTFLKQSFQEHNIEKEYRALVYGHIPTDSGMIDTPIGKSKQDYRLRDATDKAGGTMREAKTVYEVLQRLTDKEGHKYTYLRVMPKTGRTHQIRAHMKALGYSIVCDSLYAHGRICPPPLIRQGLHAFKITITLPSGDLKVFESPLPEDFQLVLDSLA